MNTKPATWSYPVQLLSILVLLAAIAASVVLAPGLLVIIGGLGTLIWATFGKR